MFFSRNTYQIMFVLLSFVVNAQETVVTPENLDIKVIANYQKGKIALRWAPPTVDAWQKSNLYGYRLVRYTVKQNDQVLPSPKKKIINEKIIPYPVEKWKTVIAQNDYAAIYAQALYGEQFSVEELQQGGVTSIINTVREKEQRFSFALFAADLDFEVALMAGLAYEDIDIKEKEEYLYRVESLVPNHVLELKMGSVVVKTIKLPSIPQPMDLIAVPQDRSVLLTWDYQRFKHVFTAYFVERSANNKDYVRLGETPVVNLNNKHNKPSKRMFYIDTLPKNDKKYYYRVVGLTPFAEVSPPSEVVSAIGIKELTTVPHITYGDINTLGHVNVYWEFPKEKEDEITEFQVDWAEREKGPYTTVITGIAPDQREATYQKPEASNYFKVSAIGKGNQKTTSFPAFVQTVDSIPPLAPVGVTGIIDSLGVVELSWSKNLEKDMLGYRVFRGHLDTEELSQITISPIPETNYVDTVQVRSLNDKVYYQVVAVDKRFNMSEYSEKIVLKKPDVIPPSSPVFTKYTVDKGEISISWVRSSSTDVAAHLLYRQNSNNTQQGWLELSKIKDTITTFVDQELIAGTTYRYAIFAVDDAGLRSDPSPPLTITAPNSGVDVVKGFTAIADRSQQQITVSWKKMPESIKELWIYKAKDDQQPYLWKQIPGHLNTLIDKKVHPGHIYSYTIKTISNTQQFSKIKTATAEY